MLVDCVDGAPSHAPIAQAKSFLVILAQPAVLAFLKHLQGFIEDCAERLPKELARHGPIEALDKSVCPRRSGPRPAVLDFVQFQMQIIGMALRAAKLPAVVREGDRKPLFLVKGQHAVGRTNTAAFGRLLVCRKPRESLLRIRHDVQMHPTHALRRPM